MPMKFVTPLTAGLAALFAIALVGCSSGPVKKTGLTEEPIVLVAAKPAQPPTREQFVSDVVFNIRKAKVQFDSQARANADRYAREQFDIQFKPRNIEKSDIERAIREQLSDPETYIRNYPNRNANRSVSFEGLTVKWLDSANAEAVLKAIDRWTPTTNPEPYAATLTLTFKLLVTESPDRLTITASDFASETDCGFNVAGKGRMSCTYNPSNFTKDEFFAAFKRTRIMVQKPATAEEVAKAFISINRLK